MNEENKGLIKEMKDNFSQLDMGGKLLIITMTFFSIVIGIPIISMISIFYWKSVFFLLGMNL